MPYRAFVSSTYSDLKDHRAAVIATLRRAGFDVDAMEEWTSDAEQPKDFSRRYLEQCDLLVLLVGHRLGHVPRGETRSITQLEYDWACRLGKDVLVFMQNECDGVSTDKEVGEWRAGLLENHGVSEFGESLASIDVAPALARWLQRQNIRRVPRQIPEPPDDFCGRAEEVASAVAAVSPGEARSVLIAGLGGVGKSALAFEMASQLAVSYRDGQIYIDLRGVSDNPVPVATVMQHVVRCLKPDVTTLDDPSVLATLYASLLAEKKTLLLFDNAASREQVVPLLPDRGSVAIVTSRQHFVLPSSHRIELGGLPQKEAEALLKAICPIVSGSESEIVRLCDHLPLAIRIAADTLLTRPDLSASDFVKRLEDEQRRLARLDDGGGSGIRASLALSYRLLNAEQRSALRFLSVCSGAFDRSALLAVLNADEELALDLVGALLRHSLIEWQGANVVSGYRLHDLVRLFARGQMEDGEYATALARHVRHFSKVLTESADSLRGGRDGLAVFDAARRNIDLMVRAMSALPMTAVGEAEAIARALCETADVLSHRLNRSERIDWLLCGVRAAEIAGDASRQCWLMSAAGNCLGNEGNRARALELLGDAIRLAEARHLQRELCHAMNLLGQVYWRGGEPEKALECFQRSTDVAEQFEQADELCDLFVNISLVQEELGQSTLSLESAQRALAIAQQIGNRRVEGQACSILSVRKLAANDIERAIGHAEEALVIAQELGDRHLEAVALNLLGASLRKLGSTGESIDRLQAAKDIFVDLEDWYFAADASRQLSLSLEQGGRASEALAATNESREYRRRTGRPPRSDDSQRLAALEYLVQNGIPGGTPTS